MCVFRVRVPCFLLNLGGEVTAKTVQSLNDQGETTSGYARKLAYQNKTCEKHEFLGSGVRVDLSHCVMANVRERFLDRSGQYMGLRLTKQELYVYIEVKTPLFSFRAQNFYVLLHMVQDLFFNWK